VLLLAVDSCGSAVRRLSEPDTTNLPLPPSPAAPAVAREYPSPPPPPPPPPPILVDWDALRENIVRSSLLASNEESYLFRHGLTVESDIRAMIYFFNNTAASAIGKTESNPYRGAFAQISEWKHQSGWESIVRAHSNVAVQCKQLYLEGGQEFVAKMCYWNVDAVRGADDSEVLRYPEPEWTIVYDCCNRLERPVLQLTDAVWATTRGVGRLWRAATAEGESSNPGVYWRADDFDYVPMMDCDSDINADTPNCDPTSFNLHTKYTDTPSSFACANLDTATRTRLCPPSTRPVGLRSKNYFNVGMAVGDGGVIVRTLDGGYSWECMRKCSGNVDVNRNLTAISTNVHMGAVGYESAYYSGIGPTTTLGDVTWTQLELDGVFTGQGLDGVYWDPAMYLEGWVVGKGGTIIRIINGGVSGWQWDDREQLTSDTWEIEDGGGAGITPNNPDGSGCATTRNINDVFFWNNHLSFFVGDAGFICRYGILMHSTQGPGVNAGRLIEATNQAEIDELIRWEPHGADNQALNWGFIVDNKDYMYANLKSIFCLQVSEINSDEWSTFVMDESQSGITYSSHLSCFAVGSHPGTAGTTSAILRYQSASVFVGLDADTARPNFREEIQWKPQDSRTSTTLNDVYCVKAKTTDGAWLGVNDRLFCYAVGDGGIIRYTSNGGISPWRTLFSGVTENLRKVVILGMTHDRRGFGGGDGDAGQSACIVGDNGRILYTNDGGNTWEKPDRVSPEHLIAVQFNAFDDFYYAEGAGELSAAVEISETGFFEPPMGVDAETEAGPESTTLPFGNGVLTGSVLFDWPRLSRTCGDGSPNQGATGSRNYNCKFPEVSSVLRTNCGGTLVRNSQRCKRECTDKTDTVPVILEATLASDDEWRAYFGFTTSTDDATNEVTYVDTMPRDGTKGAGTALLSHVRACDEVWTIGHGTMWHEDTRETRRYTNYLNAENQPVESYVDVQAVRPAHDMCLYGWPRHHYQMHEGRLPLEVTTGNVTTTRERTAEEYSFLSRLRPGEENCTLMGGTYYAASGATLADCVFEFGNLGYCPSWEVHGMAHSGGADIVFTYIPFVNFSSISDPCTDQWYGITCEAAEDDARPGEVANQTLSQMWLYSNNLQGMVPTSLVALTSLRSLSLGSNALIGTVPPEVWVNMSQLRYLSMASNQLTGNLPSEIGAITALEEMRIHENSLGGALPSELGALPAVLSLSLHENRFAERLPTELGALSSMQYLWLSNNNFSGPVPSQLGNLSQLRFLWFANNSLESLPRQLGKLGQLRSLDGSNNSIVDRLPYAFGKLQNLRKLQLYANRIRATIPDALGLCTSLVVLELQHNQLVGPIPASFGGLAQLTLLDLSANLLERTISEAIEGMHALQVLTLNDNFLEGGLPSAIGRLRSLSSINVANNLLTDALPEELVSCDRLEMLNLEGNQIGGALPSGLWRLQMLEYLVLNDNLLTGPLPEGIGYLSQLRELRLHNNRIGGTLPATIGDAYTLEILRLDNNLVSGSLPSTLGKLRNVHYLDVHTNAFGGSIPSEVDGLHSVEYLYLDHNQLASQLPFTMGNLSLLRDLRLSHNLLTGEIPPTLGKLELLVKLSVDNNRVGGSVPAELGELEVRLQKLHLQNNELGGLVPTFFKRTKWRTMDINLAGNPFWCPLPAWPTIYTASCVHCPNDTMVDDKHRTCSDHGVCIDGERCRCDPRWEGGDCELLRCPSKCNYFGEPVGLKGNCINARVPEVCSPNSTVDATGGMCTNIDDDCVAAYHDCPSNGISLQVDSEGIVIAVEPRHNTILYARCVCVDEWSGNDCSVPPPEPPTEQPWPDPYEGFSFGSPAPRASRPGLLGVAVALATALGLRTTGASRHWAVG